MDADPIIDRTKPHSARVWDYLLGGKDNYAVDREAGDNLLRMFPDFAQVARLQREFLRRAVTYLVAEAGIRQFLDIGTGLPTADNTHEVAQRIAPESRIVYVDNDPLVLVHARALLTSRPEGVTDYIDADVRDPATILEGAAKTLDFSRPIGLMMLSIAGQVPDSDLAADLVRQYVAALPSGSHLALSDGVNVNPALVAAVSFYNERAAFPYTLRSPEQLADYFEGLELVEPGVVSTPLWRPPPGEQQPPSAVISAVCGIGRKS
ncbi:SAM-dependent methyltransferase [Nonomuraea turkmeniaca]|uniref:SAM-dependent methyltransferase n=1 Tax=Nonomuraea turkmeniaca TaxID=103838 RepID=A0A5S4FMM9_9ACTN|nr:SAM-dependent methyltransferase [Nonomuraea turkmeniaca]TMR21987.1 SAM-dependent methyltransferase [Nonomuraea turkmeniaca]